MSVTSSRLKNLRLAKGVSQADVANRIGVTRTAYVKYESGVSKPVRKLQEIADYFNVTTDYLLGNDAGAAPVGGDESRLLGYFRAMPEAGRQALLMVAQQMQVSAR